MKFKKKLASVLASAVLVGAIATPSLAVAKDPNLDNVKVKVWKNIQTGEEFSGMGKHAEKCFEEGVGLVKGDYTLKRAYTKKIRVLFITGSIEALNLNGESGNKMGDDTFKFDGVKAKSIGERRYFNGKAIIKVMKNSEKNLDLEVLK
ncbi:hypothetical protein [Peptostreptococcus stomatis]|uniref:hypothetical protein n=1 Tax=Peptostreptococcus stomatis TaxID=341694 RepID=UPI00399348C9